MSAFLSVVLSSAGSGLAMGRSPAQGVLLAYPKLIVIWEVSSDLEHARGCNLCNVHAELKVMTA
jgi:hypothetical protein